ncbi:SpaA isopeptide-forming pilin-related protein [Peptoniphilus sp. BV3C26]|uniref:SpaA isopeptide-forming pilin-related protein n=1 Tax=Peptoniphilus sp. BV3C26 TaxID=1111134 RepID=UPI0003B80929|nr:SpaA isopeptide-forming pilin-related protein [Peptoniphilus sp. BV3C26]ERT60105.1 LPXTG cell wall anchor domain protein [Peptoniphilus sp. BV3C26]
MKQVSKRVISFLLAALIIMDVFAPLNVSANNYEMNKRPVSKDLIIDEEGQSAPKTPGKNDLLIYQENEEKQQNQGIEENKERKENQRGPSAPIEEKKTIIPKEKPDPVKKDYIAWRLVDPGKTVYNKGEKLDLSNLLVEVTNSNGQTFHLGYTELINDKIISVKENIKSKSYLEPGSGTLTLSAPYLNDININIQVLDNKSNELKENPQNLLIEGQSPEDKKEEIEDLLNNNNETSKESENFSQNQENKIEENSQELTAKEKAPELIEKLTKGQNGDIKSNLFDPILGNEQEGIDPFGLNLLNPLKGFGNEFGHEDELTIEELEAGLTKVQLPGINQKPVSSALFRSAFRSAGPLEGSNEGLEMSEEFSRQAVGSEQSGLKLEGKKFHIITRFETSNKAGAIQPGQFFKIHLDDKLKVNEGTVIKPIIHNNETIATPQYNPQDNTIIYTITKEINDNIQVPLDIPVDYNPTKITLDSDGTFTVTNKVSGLGVKAPKDLIPTKVNKYGIVTNQIIEPGRKDVEKIIDPGTIEDYKVDIDGWARPVIEKGELAGYNWTIKVLSNQDLQGLGYKANFTTVKGSGLGEIEDKSNLGLTDQLSDAFGIVDSKHHEVAAGIKEITYNFYTPVTNKQAAYMMDFSAILTNKRDKAGKVKVGAKRFVAEDAYNQNAIGQATPNRVGMNNRTTILGEFAKADKAKWTVTDAVSTGDDGKLPLANREFSQNQTINNSQMAVYGLDTNGKMVVKQGVTDLNGNIPAEGTNPEAQQDPGTIAVYEYDTDLQNPNTKEDYNLNGVSISKYRDLYVTQIWNLPVDQAHRKMPAQTIKAVATNDPNTTLGSVDLAEEELSKDKTERLVTIPNVKYWDIDENGNATNIDHKIEQTLPTGTVNINGTNYKYVENANYYRPDYNDQLIRNTLITAKEQNPVTFKIKKVDSKTGKGLAGARFKLWKADIEVTTDANGEAVFTNIVPDDYQLIETKAPDGYKLDQANKYVKISNDGKISLSGSNASLNLGLGKTETIADPNYPDYMNAMHYGKLDKNGNLEFYIYLKALDQQRGGDTDRNTRLNIDIPGVTINDVAVFDVNGRQRPYVRNAMENQTVDGQIPSLGRSVLNAKHDNIIVGKNLTAADPYTGKTTGYQITFPKERFKDYWGFLVRVKAKVGSNTDTKTVSYDWLTEKDTATNAKIRQNETLSSNTDQKDLPTITVTNEEFKKSPIEVTKFGDEVTEVMVDGKKTKKRNVLGGAEFTLKDKDGNPIATKITDDAGKANFGEYPTGTYILEETQAPEGYEKSKVYFEVTVNEKGEVSYNPKYTTGTGDPIAGEDYDIQKTLDEQSKTKATINNVSQRFEIDEDKASSWGTQKGVWEAYRFESLMYHADITIADAKPGQIFEIQFDKNLDFTQYSSDFPKIKNKDGIDIADPYFDYKTNLLTYVFNSNAPNADVIASLEIKGIIPSKFYAKNSGDYYFTIEVGPGMDINTGNPKIDNQKITAYYDTYDRQTRPTQAYYFRDIYKQGDDWYITAIAYFNPEANYSGDGRTLTFNWMSTRYNPSYSIAFQEGIGVKPAFDLMDVKVYRTEPRIRYDNGAIINDNMPLSFGVRPEQDPNNYYLVNHTPIGPTEIDPATGKKKMTINSSNGVSLTYDPNQIKTTGGIYESSPLSITMPRIGRYSEGYLVEQTFKVTDLNNFINLSRAFYMDNGRPNYQRSAFINSANFNKAISDQVGPEIPSLYREDVGLINKKYIPGQFKILKTNELTGEKLKGASFELTEAANTNKKIIRTSDTNGEVLFNNLAPGRYTLKETTAPDKYVASNTVWQITVFNDGSVKIVETSVSGSGQMHEGTKDITITLPVTNRPVGTNFQVFKKDGDGKPLGGAKFKITKQVKPGETGYTDEKTSDEKGVVNFDPNLTEGTYIIEETLAPDGYKKLDKKWVLVIDKKGNKKVYNYREQSGQTNTLNSILEKDGVNWVDVAGRSLDGWNLYDNRRTGWTGNYPTPFKMGTRIVAINRTEKYVIQRYVLNPEGADIKATSATIHREKPEYPNMDWFNGNAQANIDYQVFELDKPVTGQISDIRLAEYNPTNITNSVTVSKDESHYGETRMKLNLPAMTKPVVIDIKVPYTSENGGVGTGMDWTENGTIYWKSDFYERADIIKESGPVKEQSTGIQGSYISDNSLEVTNDSKTYDFKIKKYKEGEPGTLIEGAIFKLTGPDDSGEARTMTTGSDGMISFDKLKPGTYKLTEEKPAPGYKKVDTNWIVTVGKDGKTFIKEDNTQNEPGQGQPVQARASFTIGRDGDYVLNESNLQLSEILKFPVGEEKLKAESGFNELSFKEKVDAIYGTSLFERMFPNGVVLRETTSLMAKSASSNDGLEIGEEIVPGAQRTESDWEVVDHENRSRNRAGKLSASYSETKITAINKVDKRFRQVFLIKDAEFLYRANVQFYREPERYKYNLRYNDGTILRIYKVANGSTLDNPINKNDVTSTNSPANINGSKKIESGPDKGKDKPGRISAYLERTKDGYIGPYYIEIETSYDPSKGVGIGLDYIYGSYSGDRDWIKDSYVNENDINYKHLITINPSTGGSVTSSVSYEEKGKQVNLNITPDPGYQWTGTTVTDKAGNVISRDQFSFLMPDKDVIVTSTFEQTTQDVTIYFDPGVGGSGTMPSQTVPKGNYKLPDCTFTPPQGKEFKAWSLAGVEHKPGDTINVIANITLTALWKDKTVAPSTVTITFDGNGGQWHMDPKTVDRGSLYELPGCSFIAPDKTKEFDAWSINGVRKNPGDKITVNDNIIVKALWKNKAAPQPTEYTITSFTGTGGSVTADKQKAAENGQVTLTVNTNAGYTLERIWLEDSGGTEIQEVNISSKSFTMPAKDVVIKATFKEIPKTQFDITVEQTSGGNVTIDGNKTKAVEGEEIIVKVTPQQGYEVGQVTLNKQPILPQNGQYKFKMPAYNVKIRATFNPISYQTYAINIDGDSTKGSISVDDPANRTARAGQTVKFTVKANPGYKVKTVEITKPGSRDPLNTLVFNGKTGTFIMPAQAVYIKVTYEDYTPPAGTYLVTIGTGISGGTFEVDPSEAKAGEKIRLTVLPKQGYKVNSYKVTTAQGGVNVPIESDDQGLYFTMPKADVSVNGIFDWVGTNTGAYDVKLSPTEHGSLSANFSKANAGDEIYITAKPDKDYAIDSLTVTKDDGTTVELKGNKFTMPASAVTVTAKFKEVGEEIPQNGFAGIPNKQIGIEPKILKKNHKNQPLAGGVFTIRKAKDKTYKTFDENFGTITALSNEKGEVIFKENGKNLVLPKGYYLLEEIQAPLGYKKPQAPWQIEVYEENGQLKARYNGPDDTPSNFIKTASAEDKSQVTTVEGIKYKSRMIYINPQSKTYIQRIFIDTRKANSDIVNLQINPVDKREEVDTAGELPRTITQGVKTAYRSTYKIANPKATYTEDDINDILKLYDLSKPDVSMINTARWRPFDWGFDEDQLNLKKGVYYIDVEGFYDDKIIDEKNGEIKINFDFYKGERKFQQANKDGNGGIKWEDVFHGSYQQGNKNLGLSGKNPGDKYDRSLGKEGGRIEPALTDENKIARATTNISIKNLYSSDAIKHIPQEGMTILNDEETYNVTFSKHGQDDPKEGINSEAVTKRRLEGAVFKLEKARGTSWDDVDKSYVASAFNGYFGFRGLGTGRYRLIEVKAPEGYAPIKEPLLYFTIETVSITSGQLANPKTGRNVDINAVDFIFPKVENGQVTLEDKAYKFKELDMVVPETGKTIKISEASNIDMTSTEVVNPVTNEKVKLKDLSIGFDKNATTGKYESIYKLSEIQIVPKANGYISLEYDKANGVYQYVPEKSTNEKDGKLIDFVTSATAKNMGKIVNTKPGKGQVKIKKIDQAGNPIVATKLKPGAVFKVTNEANTVTKTGTVNAEGIAEIDNLPIGHYTLEEVTSPNGYINTNQVWHFTVGGKDLDPYEGDIQATGTDISSKIRVESSELKVLRPDPKDAEKYKNEGNSVIRPHTGQSLEFSNKFKLAENAKINPGDYFDLKLSDNISLNGIFVDSTESLDLFADGVGTIAKATYDKDKKTIRYVFTDYAKTYTMVEFTNKLIAFIDLYKVKTSQNNIKVGLGTGTDTSKYKNIKLVYDLAIESRTLYGNNLNMTSKIVSYDPNTGDFVHYYYINRNKTSNTGCDFYYYPNQDVKDLEIRYIKLKNNADVSTDMPESFGLDETSNNLEISRVMRSRTLLRVNEREDLNFTGGIGKGDSYIIKVTGRVAGEDKTAYGGAGELKAVYSDGGTVKVSRWDKVYSFKNEAVTKADFTISAVNPDNMIKLKKKNQDDLALAGAQFKLEKKDLSNKWNATGDLRNSDATGLVTFKNLDPGEYRIVETLAPKGYEAIEGPLVEFRVDKDGRIYRKVPVRNDKGEIVKENDVIKTVEVEEPGIVPIEIVNKKGNLIKFKKVDGVDKTGLEGAEFEVYYKDKDKDNEGKTVEYSNKNIKLYEKKNANGDVVERRVLKAGEVPPKGFTEVQVFTSGKDGELSFYVYDNGFYALKEIKAPKGYTKIPGFIKEFKLEKGEIKVFDKDYVKPKESNLVKGLQSMLTSETINVDKTNNTFAQRLVINPNHTSLTFDEYDTHLRLYVDDWNLEDSYKHIKVAVLDKGKTIDSLKETDFKSLAPSNYNLSTDNNPLRYQLKAMHRSDQDYTRPNPKGSNLITDKALVVDIVGKLNNTSATTADLKVDVYNNAAGKMIDQVTCKLDLAEKPPTKGDYVTPTTDTTKSSLMEIENRKAEYPSTGGMGTIAFTLGGVVLMSIAGILYYRKRRMTYE